MLQDSVATSAVATSAVATNAQVVAEDVEAPGFPRVIFIEMNPLLLLVHTSY